jgi:hypothetical protein
VPIILHLGQLPNPGEYVDWVRAVRGAFRAGYVRVRVRSWPPADMTPEEFTADLRLALHRRISLRGPGVRWTRKFSDSYQTDLARDARTVNDWTSHRIRFYWLATPEMRRRYAGVIADAKADR